MTSMKILRILLSALFLGAFSFVTAEELTPGFYDNANGKRDAELKAFLKSLIRNHTVIEYGSGENHSWEVFYYSDRNDEGYCMDMYCDTWYKFAAPGSVVSGCNIEHSFAKSWWGGSTNDAYKDCYHLNPSNSTANSARSNYPLGEPVKDLKTSGSLKIGKIHHDSLNVDFFVFEPKDEYKGDFARAYFYMATCYGRDADGNYDNVCTKYKGWRVDNKDVGSRFAMQHCSSNGIARILYLRRRLNAPMLLVTFSTIATPLSTIPIWQNISGARKPDSRLIWAILFPPPILVSSLV